MFWKKIIILYLALPMLFCLPSKAQKPGDIVSEQTIRKLGEKHFFSTSPIPDDIFHLMQGKTYNVLDIFRKLYKAKYPIERMRLIDYWDADDERAMRDNNSSSFNFRFISHTHTVSKHGKGLAVDINTLYNPYHKHLKNGKEVVEPATARPYLDRSKHHTYMIRKGDLCYRLFKEKGFRWGGDWKHSKDYQHFEK